MLGAIIGDIAGSPYEFNNVYKRSSVKLFKDSNVRKFRFTDDSVLSIAVARGLVENIDEIDDTILKEKIAENLKKYYRKYPLKKKVFKNYSFDPYGGGFKKWAEADSKEDRIATTNGAAMRAAAIGWLYEDIDKTMHVAKITAQPTHNSLHAIRATQAVACAIFLARNNKGKNEIKAYIEKNFKYQLGDGIDDEIEIRKHVSEIRNYSRKYRYKAIIERRFYDFIDCDAKRTVENAIYAFLISNDFEDCIKTAISFGGDSDTIACISCAIAEAYYGIPKNWKNAAINLLRKQQCQENDIRFLNSFLEDYVLINYH